MPESHKREYREARPTYGRDLIAGLEPELLDRPIVITQPEPWALVSQHFDPAATQIHTVASMERQRVEERSASFDDAGAVFGIGGGAALDHAKHTAWVRGLPLVLIPSILSVDAAFTSSIAVREYRRVRYVGEVTPAHLLVDFNILQAAPPMLNRAGVGDVLSIFTALWDWNEASKRTGERYDPVVAGEADSLLEHMMSNVFELQMVTEDGLRKLAELFCEEVRLCNRVGSSRPEEGSEHHLAYCIEATTGKVLLHGRLVAMCTCLAAEYQGQDTRRIRAFLRDLQLDCSPGAVGVTREELRRSLGQVCTFVREEDQLLPGAFHFADQITPQELHGLMGTL